VFKILNLIKCLKLLGPKYMKHFVIISILQELLMKLTKPFEEPIFIWLLKLKK